MQAFVLAEPLRMYWDAWGAQGAWGCMEEAKETLSYAALRCPALLCPTSIPPMHHDGRPALHCYALCCATPHPFPPQLSLALWWLH